MSVVQSFEVFIDSCLSSNVVHDFLNWQFVNVVDVVYSIDG